MNKRQKKRLIKYAADNFGEMLHTTLNPEGPGVVRIHLIPPTITDDNIAPSIAIINGMDIIPVGSSFTVLLSELIKEVNKYEGKAVSEDDIKLINKKVIKNVRKVYPLLPGKIIREDLFKIMYKNVGFEIVDENEEEYIMVCQL